MEEKHYLSYSATEIDARLKRVDDIPSRVGELINDVGYITAKDVPEVELPDNIATLDEVAKNYQPKGDYALHGEVPTKVSELENDKDFIALSDIDLSAYATKTEVASAYQPKGDYATAQQVSGKQDKLIAGEGISIEGDTITCTHDKTLYKVVTALPTIGEEHKIYLIVSADQTENNIYDEWAYIGGVWERLGTYKATIDLTPYALKSEIPTKTSQLINDSNFATVADIPATETYVLDFTIKDGVNTGDYSAEEYAKLRAAVEAGKLIIVGGVVTRVTADSQAMAADYLVIRYSTPRISDDNTSVTISFYELKFSATSYTSKAIHKSIK